jgi:hypothetical protein
VEGSIGGDNNNVELGEEGEGDERGGRGGIDEEVLEAIDNKGLEDVEHEELFAL